MLFAMPVERFHVPHFVLQADLQMILQVFTDARQLVHDGICSRRSRFGRADAGELQQAAVSRSRLLPESFRDWASPRTFAAAL